MSDPILEHPVGRWLLDRRSRMRRLDEQRPWVVDTVIAALIMLFTVRQVVEFGDAGPRLVVAVLLVAPLWWRRRAPVAAFAAAFVVLTVASLLSIWVPASVALLVLLNGVAARSSMRALLAVAAASVLWLCPTILILAPLDDHRPPALLLLLGTCTAAVATGLVGRVSRAYLAAVEDDRERHARLAVAAERAGVAREMHDIVGHHVSIMIGLADGGAALATSRQERSAEPLRLIAETGRQALDDLRRVLGVLRDDAGEPGLSPQPGLAEVERLLAGVRAAGLDVTYRTDGDLRHLGTGVQLAVYRIVQEALTNTLKHASGGARAEVTVAVADGEVRVRVADSGPALRRRPPAAPGHGIVGIRERAGLYDGVVTAGPANGGWVVDVVLTEPARATA